MPPPDAVNRALVPAVSCVVIVELEEMVAVPLSNSMNFAIAIIDNSYVVIQGDPVHELQPRTGLPKRNRAGAQGIIVFNPNRGTVDERAAGVVVGGIEDQGAAAGFSELTIAGDRRAAEIGALGDVIAPPDFESSRRWRC